MVGGLRSRPLTASRYLACLRVDAWLGERRAQLRVPVQPAEHFLQPIPSVGDLVVGAEQAARHVPRLGEAVAAADVVVSDRQLARHPLQHAVQIGARRGVRQEGGVLFPLLRPVHAVHVRRVEVVAVDPPRLVEDLLPLGARIDTYLDGIDTDPSLRRLDRFRCRHNRPRVAVAVQQLLAVSGDDVVGDLGKERVVLARGEVVAVERRPGGRPGPDNVR